MSAPLIRGAKGITLSRLNNPKNQRVCPVCGKHAQTKYLSDATGKWTYRHSERVLGDRGGRITKTHYHEANE